MNKKIVIGMVLTFFIFTTGLVLLKTMSSTETQPNQKVTETERSEEEEANPYVSEDEIVQITNELLDILYEVYFATQDYSSEDDSSTSGLMMSLLTETMQDKNRLDNLLPRVEKLSRNQNKAIGTTGMALYTSIISLSHNHDVLIKYIRAEDVSNPSLSEFQFQLAQFQTENKDSFFTLVEGTALYPYVFLEFAKDDSEKNKSRVSEKTRLLLISNIDTKFNNAFLEEDIWNEETGNRNAVLLIVRKYREFLVGLKEMETVSN